MGIITSYIIISIPGPSVSGEQLPWDNIVKCHSRSADTAYGWSYSQQYHIQEESTSTGELAENLINLKWYMTSADIIVMEYQVIQLCKEL